MKDLKQLKYLKFLEEEGINLANMSSILNGSSS